MFVRVRRCVPLPPVCVYHCITASEPTTKKKTNNCIMFSQNSRNLLFTQHEMQKEWTLDVSQFHNRNGFIDSTIIKIKVYKTIKHSISFNMLNDGTNFCILLCHHAYTL